MVSSIIFSLVAISSLIPVLWFGFNFNITDAFTYSEILLENSNTAATPYVFYIDNEVDDAANHIYTTGYFAQGPGTGFGSAGDDFFPFTAAGSTYFACTNVDIDFTDAGGDLIPSEGVYIVSTSLAALPGTSGLIFVNHLDGVTNITDDFAIAENFYEQSFPNPSSTAKFFDQMGVFRMDNTSTIQFNDGGGCQTEFDGIRLQRLNPFCTTTEVGGFIWHDNRGDGTIDQDLYLGHSGITVNIFDSSNTQVGTAVTDDLGMFTVTGLTAATEYRYEVTNLPAGFEPAYQSTYSQPHTGFVTSGTCDLALATSHSYEVCVGTDPAITSACYAKGDGQQAGTVATEKAMIAFDSTTVGNYSTPDIDRGGGVDNRAADVDFQGVGGFGDLADVGEIGTIWGIGYSKKYDILFTSASLKRGSNYGPLGDGGIYAITDAYYGADAVTNWFDLESIAGINTGTYTHTGLDGDGLDFGAEADPDVGSVPFIGRESLGDLDLDEENDNMAVTNLNDKTIHIFPYDAALTVPTVGTVTTIDPTLAVATSGISTCSGGGEIVPYALKFREGSLYVGMVCTAPLADLTAYVVRIDDYLGAATQTIVFEFDLVNDYAKDETQWVAWSDLDVDDLTVFDPQPIFTDIEFDTNGDMILGFLDRRGPANYDPDVVPKGDILRVCQDYSTPGFPYVLESGGECDPFSDAGGFVAKGDVSGSDGGTNLEYYIDDHVGASAHRETSLGAVALLPGTGELYQTVFNPYRAYSGGFKVNDVRTGTYYANIEAYRNATNVNFGKGQGFGDVEAMCAAAPIEIGNRVWDDTDADGIQDPGEAGIAGVTVELLDAGATTIATAVTNANGEYYFRSLRQNSNDPTGGDTDPNAADENGFVAGTHAVGLIPGDIGYNSSYTVQIPASNFAGGQPLDGLSISSVNYYGAGGVYEPTVQQDVNDSDGTDIGGNIIQASVTLDLDPGADHSIDFGFSSAGYRIGNLVWEDTNNDGDLDVGENPIAGVAVELYTDTNANGVYDGGTDVAAGTTTTDANGEYSFAITGTGDYLVVIPASNFTGGQPLDGFSTSTGAANAYEPGPDPDNDIDSDDNGTGSGTTVVTAAVTITDTGEPTGEATALDGGAVDAYAQGDNNSNLTVDFGFVQNSYRIGNLIWDDTDNDGVLDGGETGIANVVVHLFTDTNANGSFDAGTDVIAASTTTDANGEYSFEVSATGEYLVVVTPDNFTGGQPLDGYTSSTGGVANTYEPGPDPDNDTDSDDNGEYTGTGTVVSTAFTLTNSGEPTGEATALDGGAVDTYTQGDNNSNLTVDFGFFVPASLGNFVWEDTDRDGIQDGGETGIDGVTIQLYTGTGALLSTTTTAGGGIYGFTGLGPGDYYIDVTEPAAYALTLQDQGGDDTVDSDINATTGISNTVTLAAGDNNLTLDAGLYTDPDIEVDKVVEGSDADAIASDFEIIQADTPFTYTITVNNAGTVSGTNIVLTDQVPSGVTITAEVASQGTVATGLPLTGAATTGSDLVWNIGTLTAGQTETLTLTAEVTTANLATFLLGRTNGTNQNVAEITAMTETDIDSTVNNAADPFVPGTSEDDEDDARVYVPPLIGDFVWVDLDQDGIQDVGEPGLNDVTVNVYEDVDVSNTISVGDTLTTSTTVTNGGNDGYWLQSGMNIANYIVEFVVPANYNATLQDQGGDDTIDSDGVTTGVYTLNSGDEVYTVDFGVYPDLAIGNLVFEDLDNDGIYESGDGETGIQNVDVELYQDTNLNGTYDAGTDTLTASTTTTSTGYYIFNGLAETDYFVLIPQAELLAGGTLEDYQTSSGTNGSTTGAYETAPDPDNNTDNDDNGTFVSYVVSEAVTLAYNTEPTGDGSTGVDTYDNLTVDFGFYQPVSVGNNVWEDTNNDGDRDGGEPVIQNVLVNLREDVDASGTLTAGDTTILTSTTDANGHYLFTNITAGDYIIEVDATNFNAAQTLDGYNSSTGNGTAPDPDSDTNLDDNGDDVAGFGVATQAISLTVGGEPLTEEAGIEDNDANTPDANENLTVDFGFYRYASIGNIIFFDEDADGIQDGGTEVGLNGVTVELYTSTGALLATTTTSNNASGAGQDGEYFFQNIDPGDYYVQVTAPTTYQITTQDQGGDDTLDSDANTATGIMATTTLDSGESDLTWDAGLTANFQIGDYVWFDIDSDGTQDEGIAAGINGVTVNLYEDANTDGVADGASIATTVTATNTQPGYYNFAGLNPGSYLVEVVPPVGYAITTADQGGDDTQDSDVSIATGLTPTITLNSGNSPYLDWDAGLVGNLSLGDRVWFDVDNDGVLDGTETGVSGVVLNLYIDTNANGTYDSGTDFFMATTTTDATGVYTFTGLSAANYLIVIPSSEFGTGEPLEGYTSSTPASTDPDDDNNDDDDGDYVGAEVASLAVTLAGGTEPITDGDADTDSNLSIDFGFFQGQIGNQVWVDTDQDGTYEPGDGEAGISGVTLALYQDVGADGTPDVLLATTTTDASGNYSFTGLSVDDGGGTFPYVVIPTTPSGYTYVDGPNDGVDNNSQTETGYALTLSGAAFENFTADFGYFGSGSTTGSQSGPTPTPTSTPEDVVNTSENPFTFPPGIEIPEDVTGILPFTGIDLRLASIVGLFGMAIAVYLVLRNAKPNKKTTLSEKSFSRFPRR